MTLVEVLVSTAVASIVFVALISFGLFSTQSFISLTNYAELSVENRRAVDQITKEIRQANKVTGFEANPLAPYQTNKIVFLDGNNQVVTYHFKPALRQLERETGGGAVEILLNNCDYLEFNLMQRNPTTNGFSIVPASSIDTIKVVQMRWRSSKEIMGSSANTENIQTAQIVIRKQGSI